MKAKVLADAAWMRGAEVPAHWQRTKVKHLVASLRAGDAIAAEDIEATGLFPVYGANGVRGFTQSKNAEGTFALIGRQGALCGNVHLVSGSFWASEHAIVATPAAGTEPRFLAALLDVMDLGQYSTNAAQPGIGVAQIAPLDAYVPTLDEQRKIADFLDAETAQIDTLIAEQERFIELLRERRIVIVADATVNGLVADARSKVDERVWSGRRPAHWSVQRLSWFVRLHGSSGPDDLEVSADAETPYFKVASLNTQDKRGFAVGGDEFVSRRWATVPAMSILIPKRGAAIFTNKVAMTRMPCAIDSNLMGISVNSAVANPRFVAYWLKGRRLDELADTSTLPQINNKHIYPLKLALPPLVEQDRVIEHLDAATDRIDALIVETERNVALSKERRAALITAAVTGQIDLSAGRAA